MRLFWICCLLGAPLLGKAQNAAYHQVFGELERHHSLAQDAFFYSDSLPSKKAFIRPLLDLGLGGQADSSQLRTLALGGFDFSLQPHQKWLFKGSILGSLHSNGALFLPESNRSVPFVGYSRPIADGSFGRTAIRPEASLSYSPNKYVSLTLGHGNHHWGIGHRSLWLGQTAPNYSYGRIDTEFWNLHYTNLYMRLLDVGAGQNLGDARVKYVASHNLSWQVTQHLNISFFEAVVWQATDTLSNRQFEFNYINPVIFYRPIEFAQGSADNVLVGLSAHYDVDGHVVPYFQFLLDEFLLSELREGRGWWANKFGWQFGVKALQWPNEKWNALAEVALMRPFTYSHGSQVQSYGHLNQPLAHPLGANFYEAILKTQYNHNRLRVDAQFTLGSYGRDVDGENLGGNIFRSYVGPARVFGNEIGQGLKTNLYQIHARAAYQLKAESQLRAYLEAGIRHSASQAQVNTNPWVNLGLQLDLQRPQTDF